MEDMTAERFFSFADRLVAYKGAIRMSAERGSNETTSRPERTPNASSQASPSESGEKKYFRDIKHNPELAQYFD